LPYIKQNSQATCLYVTVEQWVVCLFSRVAKTSDKSIQSFFSIIYFVWHHCCCSQHNAVTWRKWYQWKSRL